MTDGIEAITTQALGLALDAASLRQQAIASNVANANVDGYVPLAVNFESQLADVRRSLGRSGRLDAHQLADVTIRIEPDTHRGSRGLPPTVQLDAEVAQLARNGMQYQALVKGLSRHYELLQMAVKDGK